MKREGSRLNRLWQNNGMVGIHAMVPGHRRR